jgi:hypothetical protein
MLSLFKGPDGKVSMMRTLSFSVCFIILGVFVAHNIVSMVKGAGFVSMGLEEASIISLTLGAKAAQTFAEPKKAVEKLSEDIMPNSGE